LVGERGQIRLYLEPTHITSGLWVDVDLVDVVYAATGTNIPDVVCTLVTYWRVTVYR